MDDLKFPGLQPLICKPEGNRFADWALKQTKDVHRFFASSTTQQPPQQQQQQQKQKQKQQKEQEEELPFSRTSDAANGTVEASCKFVTGWLVWDSDIYNFQRQQLGKWTVDGLEIQRSPVDILNLPVILRRWF